jgi:SagB-type dehydrogenase family enzyme
VTREAVERYHRLTSYAPGREWDVPLDDPWIRTDLAQNDWALYPPPVKRYPQELEVVELPREWRSGALDLAGLSRLLFLSCGIVRTSQRPGRPLTIFRAAGSAGARYPYEVYVAASGVGGLDDGVWWYDPEGHALRRVGPAPAGGATTVVATGVPWRTGWRYAERGYRHLYWDCGTMLSQVLALAESAGVRARLWTRFPDASVAALVGADGVHEFPLALVALGEGSPPVSAGGAAERGEIDSEPQEYPLVTATQRAGDEDTLGESWPEAEAAPPPPSVVPPLDEVILKRGSTRLMDRSARVAREVVEWSMALATRAIDVPHFVVAHGVDGIDPGVYRWPDLDRAVGPVTREEMHHICVDQGLGADAAFVVIGAADLADVDARRYRELQLAAGLVEGRLHLAAYTLGLGASGMTFYDALIPDLLHAPLSALLFTCVGAPEYRSKPGGRPGAPTPVVVPTPRAD